MDSRENLDNTINNSMIKENPFEADNSKAQNSQLLFACSPVPPLALKSTSKILDEIEARKEPNANRLESGHLPLPTTDSRLVSLNMKMMEEVIVIGLTRQTRDNLRNFPLIGEIEYKCKLIHSYPSSEKS